MPPAHSVIPEIPGELLQDHVTRGHLADRVAQLCKLNQTRFPGSQPVSFSLASLDLLEQKDFWVCEKSDGVRILIYIVMNKNTHNQEVWLIDRKQRYFSVHDLHFPHWENQDAPLDDTILDGELVLDVDPRSGAEVLRFYAFDCLVLNGENIMWKPLQSRYGRLKTWVIAPHVKALQRIPEWRDALPFEVLEKKQELSYHIAEVLHKHIPQLQHGHDGLIFTCVESQYVPGTDENILKWKPPSENSIDFKLELRFPPSAHDPTQPDYYSKPQFLLNTWLGGQDYEYFDALDMEDEEWQRRKESQEQLDDRIVEVCWDADASTWKILRFRDDKPNANHKSIMEKILLSIEDGVEIEALLARSDSIKTTWKHRQSSRQPAPPPPPLSRKTTQPPAPVSRTDIGPGAPAQGIMAGLRR
ncbi:mRNA guanylyltransferase, partial [Tremellales sp. Uapishka_1]